MLNEVLFFDTLRETLWISVIISLPILAVALVAGLVVGLFQALTSIQELTLTCPSWARSSSYSGSPWGS